MKGERFVLTCSNAANTVGSIPAGSASYPAPWAATEETGVHEGHSSSELGGLDHRALRAVKSKRRTILYLRRFCLWENKRKEKDL